MKIIVFNHETRDESYHEVPETGVTQELVDRLEGFGDEVRGVLLPGGIVLPVSLCVQIAGRG